MLKVHHWKVKYNQKSSSKYCNDLSIELANKQMEGAIKGDN